MRGILKKIMCTVMVCTFLFSHITTGVAQAQVSQMPEPGSMIGLSQPMVPATLQGMKVDPKEPFRFQFLLAPGDKKTVDQEEADRLVRHFFAALATPEEGIWVNLSPLEHDRIVQPDFGRTRMGRELLELDHILKQLTSSLMYPEGATGKDFWNKVYAKAYDFFGTTNIPTDVFNKVWIVSGQARVYENAGAVYITGDTLDVMLDSDHALAQANGQASDVNAADEISRQMMRESILPVIKKEVNEGAQFAPLRKIHRALILATWYKKRMKESLLGRAYADQNKVEGVTHGDPTAIEHIYNNYVEAFKQGVYNYVREEKDIYTGEVIPRKYFAGGMAVHPVLENDPAASVKEPDTGLIVETVDASPIGPGISTLEGPRVFEKKLLGTGVRSIKKAFLLTALGVFLASSGHAEVIRDVNAGDFNKKAMRAVKLLEDPDTRLVPSHVGMPQLENIAFAYDLAVQAGAFKAAGEDAYARTIMDFFMNGLSNPRLAAPINGQRGFMNAVNINTGDAGLEYFITPGPSAWIGLSALNVDPQKYKPLALAMGDLLLSFQDADGGVADGNREPGVVNTEPHMDAVAFFYALHNVYGDKKWKEAADKGKEYFYRYLYVDGHILQSRGNQPENFVTDAYSWTLLGRVGQELPASELKALVNKMLNAALVRVQAPIPGGEMKTLTLTDFTDPRSSLATSQRGGIRPLGTVEWTGGVVMALQVSAVRLAGAGDMETARLYKGIAEELLRQSRNAFGTTENGGIIAFYATEAGVQTGFGWKTPFPADLVRGSSVGYWIIYPSEHVNPFTGENYGAALDVIGVDVPGAAAFINNAVQGKEYVVPGVVESKVDPAARVGGIDLQKIDLSVDVHSGAVSFEVNDAVVAALQERMFGLEPVIISSVPLADLQGFLQGVR